MKRSEALVIVKARAEFDRMYKAVSIGEEEYFSHSGCELCAQGLAGSVYDVTAVAQSNEVFEYRLCGGCSVAVTYGDNSDLDFSVDEEDIA
jgi:hypothetical protein